MKDISGIRFGKLVVTKKWKFVPRNDGRRRIKWLCKCDCGEKNWVLSDQLVNGKTKSCGCWNIEAIIRRNTTHGLRYRPEYKIWMHMKQRCTNPKNKDWRLYGCRGITVSKEWLDFKTFFRDMGPRPEGMKLDRIDNDKGYSKDNCRWTTDKVQANNKRNNRPEPVLCDNCKSIVYKK